MSLGQLYTLYDEIDIENTFAIANSDEFWNQASIEERYKAYICAYVHFNREIPHASFMSFVNKIKHKLSIVSEDIHYSQLHQNLSIHNIIHMNNIIMDVNNGEKTWLQGLQEIYTLNDLSVYGW